MIRLGKTFSNLMVDVQKTNVKLHARARRIVAQACEISENEAQELLAHCEGEVKTAIVTCRGNTTPDDARRRLASARNIVRKALEDDAAP
jgi:N-acetylmuramic acid 6-phosphate etherase